MQRRLDFTHRARKELEKLSPEVRARVVAAMRQYAADPASAPNIKKLRGRVELRRRIGDWRVLFIDDGMTVLVTAVRHRRKAY